MRRGLLWSLVGWSRRRGIGRLGKSGPGGAVVLVDAAQRSGYFFWLFCLYLTAFLQLCFEKCLKYYHYQFMLPSYMVEVSLFQPSHQILSREHRSSPWVVPTMLLHKKRIESACRRHTHNSCILHHSDSLERQHQLIPHRRGQVSIFLLDALVVDDRSRVSGIYCRGKKFELCLLRARVSHTVSEKRGNQKKQRYRECKRLSSTRVDKRRPSPCTAK